jgi:hypothetical protein
VRRLGALAFIVTMLVVAPARAEPSATEVAAAREQSRMAVQAAHEGRWVDALAGFRKAYELSPDARTLLNIASAEAQTGALVSAADTFRKVLRAGKDELSDDERAAAKTALARTEARIAHLRIVVRAKQDEDRVELDGSPLSAAALQVALPLDPGPHHVRIIRNGAEVAHTRRSLSEGESATIAIEPAEPEPPPPVRPQGKAIYESVWFWVGAGVVATAGTVAVLCVASFCQSPSPHAASMGSVTLK